MPLIKLSRRRLFVAWLFAGLPLLPGLPSVLSADPASDVAEGRAVQSAAERNYWLANMAAHHFTAQEVSQALNVSAADASTMIERFRTDVPQKENLIDEPVPGKIVILPYPGGRHPRIGFLEGAIRPQRETKISVFAPWKDGGYLVVDLPEAVWHKPDDKRELLYLAHTHIPTIWDKQQVQLKPLEWNRDQPGRLSLTRELPNQVRMTSWAMVADGGVRLAFAVTNNSEAKLTGLHTQVCGMLKGLNGFDQQTNDNKVFSTSFAACRSGDGQRWVILGFDHCLRAWGNAKCPCLHADPQVPDCAPGETQTVHGWVSFYEGEEVAGELKRLEKIAFRPFE